MQSKATSVQQYLDELPEDRRQALQAIREVILKNVDHDIEEGMQYGMIGYYVPHRVYPAGYHCDPKQPLPYLCMASQKNHMALYMMVAYIDGADDAWFRKEWAATGRKLDMGKCCIRFRKLEDVALDVVAEAIRRVPTQKHIEIYENVFRDSRKSRPATTRKAVAGKSPAATKSAAALKKQAPKKTAAAGRTSKAAKKK